MQKIAIIGAGVSGMSAAHFLKDRYNVTVFEKEKTLEVLLNVVVLTKPFFILVVGMSLIQNIQMC